MLVINMMLISFVNVCFPKILYGRKEAALWPLAEQNLHLISRGKQNTVSRPLLSSLVALNKHVWPQINHK